MNLGAPNEGRLGAPVGAEDVGVLWRVFFWAAALFNAAVGLVGMLVPPSNLDGRLVGVLLFAFGIAFALVARDPLRYRSVLWAGLVGKGGMAALLASDAVARGGDGATFAIIAIEVVFVIGFLGFLLLRDDQD